MLIARLLPGLLRTAAVYVAPKAFEVNSSSQGCEDEEESAGACPLPAVPGSRRTKPSKAGEEPAAARGTLPSCKNCTPLTAGSKMFRKEFVIAVLLRAVGLGLGLGSGSGGRLQPQPKQTNKGASEIPNLFLPSWEKSQGLKLLSLVLLTQELFMTLSSTFPREPGHPGSPDPHPSPALRLWG